MFYYCNSICYDNTTSASTELWYSHAHSLHSHCGFQHYLNSDIWVQKTKGDGVGVQQVTEEGLIIWDRLPGMFNCTSKTQTHTYSHTPAAVWVDMTWTLPGLTLKGKRAQSLWSWLQADAGTDKLQPPHLIMYQKQSFSQTNRAKYTAFTSLTITHTSTQKNGDGPTQTFHHAFLCVCCCDTWQPYSAISEVRSNVLGSQDALRA